jgi:glucan phosphoethanolaminetransferase (alkaline phosphatase superfamily)
MVRFIHIYLFLFCITPEVLIFFQQLKKDPVMALTYLLFSLIFFGSILILSRSVRRLTLIAVFYSVGGWFFFVVNLKHQGVPAAMLIDIVATSNLAETTEYLQATGLLIWLFVFLFAAGLAFLCACKIRDDLLPASWRKNVFAFNLIAFAISLHWDYLPWGVPPFPSPISDLAATQIYPSAIGKILQVSVEKMTSQDIETIQLVAKRGIVPEEDEVHVLVIGESSRFDRWQVNGYARQTSPFLSRLDESEFLSFKRVHGGGNLTIVAVPILLTGMLPEQYQASAASPTILDYMKKAGFMTAWLSSQDLQVGAQAKVRADLILARNNNMGQPKYLFERLPYDEELLPLLDQVLQSSHPKKFIVLHTTGNHMDYHLRYPPRFAQFSSKRDGLYLNHQELQDSYDNSILYVDWFLDQVIQKLKSQKKISSVSFISDHGDDLFDYGVRRFGHGSSDSSRYEQHIPYFMWGSEAFRVQYESQWDQLKRRKDVVFGAENYFHTMLDLLDVQYPAQRHDLSILKADYQLRAGAKTLASSGNLVEIKVP